MTGLAIASGCIGFGLGVGFLAGALYEFFRQDNLRRESARRLSRIDAYLVPRP